MEHGHRLLVNAVRERRPEWLGRQGIHMLEVGTTRDPSPVQDSTRVLAEVCRDNGWSFTTCDMDPANTERARQLFAHMGVPFTAVTDKGEEYIARGRRAYDVVYLDAYDFDHGKHSEDRQRRYEEFLGSRIDQHECEVMHLKAMQGLARAARRGCMVVIDDTWRDGPDGPWMGKGPLAVPWSEANGWDLTVVDQDHRAVVLERQSLRVRTRIRASSCAARTRRGIRCIRRILAVPRGIGTIVRWSCAVPVQDSRRLSSGVEQRTRNA